MNVPTKLQLSLFIVIPLLAIPVVHGRSDPKRDGESILRRSVSALGGEEKLRRLDRVYFRCKVSLRGTTGEYEHWRDAQIRGKIFFRWEESGKKFQMIRGFNETEGWVKTNDEPTRNLTAAEEQQQDSSYENDMRALVPFLKDKETTISVRGDMEIEGRRLVRVRVITRERSEMDLYFDKSTALLWKYSTNFTSDEVRGKVWETYYSNYRDFDGLKYAVNSVMKIDGEVFAEDEVIELRTVKEFPVGPFSKP